MAKSLQRGDALVPILAELGSNIFTQGRVAESMTWLEENCRKGRKLRTSSQTRAAELFNVSPKTVSDARVVQNADCPELADQVRRGEKSVSRAAQEVRELRYTPVHDGPREHLEVSLTIGNDGPRDAVAAPPTDLRATLLRDALDKLAQPPRRDKRGYRA